jgi:hypothetical protein
VPLNRLPERPVLDELARALRCHLYLVIESLAEDVDVPWGPPLDDPELGELVRVFLLYPPETRKDAVQMLAQFRLIADPLDRQSLMRAARAFSGGATP